MSCKDNLRTRIVERLSGAHFPIRDPDELAEALGASEPDTGDFRDAPPLPAAEIVELLSPREYLFTNPWQVADLVAQRAAFPVQAATLH
jgi:hypothetical protein